MIPLHYIVEIMHARVLHTWLIMQKQKVFLYNLKLRHNVRYRRTEKNGRQLVPIARSLLKYCWLENNDTH